VQKESKNTQILICVQNTLVMKRKEMKIPTVNQ